jgi:hypothetical protein
MSEDNPKTTTPEEHSKIIEEKYKKLKLMETELKQKCDEFDAHKKMKEDELAAHKKMKEDELAAREENLIQRTGNLDASGRFMKIQALLDEVYTLFVVGGGKPEDLYASIKLTLEARDKFSPNDQ